MNIQRRVIGSSVVVGRNGEITGLDLDLLIQRLLLFDGYVLRTTRFKEVPYLVQAFGYDQTLELLTCGLLEIRCEVTQMGSRRDEELKRLNRLAFDLIWIEAHDREKYLADCLNDVRTQLSLEDNKWRTLEAAIRDRIRRIDDSTHSEIGEAFKNTLDKFPAVVAESTRMAAKRQRIPMVLPEFRVDLERKDGQDLMYANTDLRYTRIPRENIWTIVRDGLMGIGTLEQSIGEMKGFHAIGGFAPAELPLFQSRLSSLARLVSPHDTEQRLARLMNIAGLPHFAPDRASFKLDKLLAARESDELRVFRDWLPESDRLSDTEVRSLVKGFRARVSIFVRGGSATMTRLMVETGLGVVNAIAGAALSALDYFVLDRLLPTRGPAAFVNKTFPTMFETRK